MSKTNYKAGDHVKILKVGFEECEGEVISNKPGTGFRPLLVEIKTMGTWSFYYEEVKPVGKEKAEVYAFDQPAKTTAKKATSKKPISKKPKTK